MALRVFKPSQLLAPYVEAFWDYEDLLEAQSTSLSILPDTASYLCFLYQDPLQTVHRTSVYSTRSGLAGFQSYRSDLGGFGRISGVSARLTVWGLNAFRRGVIVDCAERRVDCRDLFPGYVVERIEEDIARLKVVEERVSYIERFLLSILNLQHEDKLIQEACKVIRHSKGNCRISALASHFELSKRTLERRFYHHIGATPKKYARVIRLRHTLLEKTARSSWADVALDMGYYDQSHMIHDFMELYGYSPETLHPQMPVSPTFSFSGLINLCPVQ